MTAIDSAISETDGRVCRKCGGPLGGAPSDDFCSEDCQALWLTGRASGVAAESAQEANEQSPEVTPLRPLDWLGPAPPGAIPRQGYDVLDEVAEFVSRYSVFPDDHCVPTLTLWYAHTHVVDRFYITPRLVLDSAEPGSGKTRVLEVAAHLVAAPEMTISATPAALFRLVSAGPISILFDEVDAIFNQNGGSNEDLRALLNAGYKNGATVARCVGDAKAMKVQRFHVFAPAALAGIAGAMPDTITTRAVTIHMRRRRADQAVEPFRQRVVERTATPVRESLAAWMSTIADEVGVAEPDIPDGVTDRPAEIWEPLLAIADAAGGHWPATARAACKYFVLDSGPQVRSAGVRLLADLRAIFTRHQADRLPSAVLLAELLEMEESGWADLEGRPLDARRLSKELGRYGVRVVPFKHASATVKGYVTYGTDRQLGLADAWSRYLPAVTEPAGSGNPSNSGNPASQPVTDESPVTDPSVTASKPGTHDRSTRSASVTDPSVTAHLSVTA
jgi:hypothetical protein